jgi:conjugal transfer pilus assembly protein TrbC
MPTQAELEAARAGLPSQAEMEKAQQAQQRSGGIRLPQGLGDAASPSAPDLSRLAEQFEQLRRGPPAGGQGNDREASGLMIFVSLGMPEASLKRLIADASRLRGTLVLRGVRDRSMAATTTAIAGLMQERQVPWQIDPVLFKRFEVQAVPAVVLIDPGRPVLVDCGTSRCQEAAYAKVSGDVTLSYALQVIERQDPALAGLARQLGQTLNPKAGKP